MQKLIIFLKKKELFLSSIIILLSIFFWDIKINNFIQSKFFIALLIPYFFLNLNKSNFLIISLTTFSFLFFLFVHAGLNTDFKFTNYFIFSIIYLLLLSLISSNTAKNFEDILFNSTKIFIILINGLICLELFYSSYFLYDHQLLKNGVCVIFHSENKNIIKYFFLENSHFGMISVAVIIYQLSNYSRLEILHKINFIIFIIFAHLFLGSMTLYFGIVASIIFIIFFRIYNKILPIIILLILNIFIIFNFENCALRISQVKDMKNIYINEKDNKIEHVLNLQNLTNFLFENKKKSVEENKKKSVEENKSINVTTVIHINHINFAIETIEKNYFGVGFQNYGIYSLKYAANAKLIKNFETQSLINYNDGASNLTKLFTEFGILNIFFLILFIYSFSKSRFRNETKLFILCLVITQLIRGAGYFNGGFIFIIMLLIYSAFFELNDASPSV